MKTLFQDYEGSIPELEGSVCESLLCVQVRDDDTDFISPGVLWLKILDGQWYRIFIDAGLYYLSLTEYEQLDRSDIEDEESFPVLDVAEQCGLYNFSITKVEMNQSERASQRQGCLTISFSEGAVLKLICGDIGTELIVT